MFAAVQVKENVLLREGDLIKFGHVNGAAIKAGQFAPKEERAEFVFRFERALPNYQVRKIQKFS